MDLSKMILDFFEDSNPMANSFITFRRLDIFGSYCIIDNSLKDVKYKIVPASKAVNQLKIIDHSLAELRRQYVVNVSVFRGETRTLIGGGCKFIYSVVPY